MNYLFVFADNAGSANNKITLSLAEEMAKTNEVYGCFCFNENVHDRDTESLFKNSILIGNYNDPLYSHLESKGWRAQSVSQKIVFLITHPITASRYVYHRVVRGILQKKSMVHCTSEIEEFAEAERIDCVIGFTNPYCIARMIASLHGDYSKALFQMDPYSTYQYLSERNRSKRRRQEIQTLKKLDRIYTTQLIIDDMIKYGILTSDSDKPVRIEFPMINTKRVHEEESESVKNAKSILEKKDGCIYFLHAGTLIERIRNPKVLIDIFEKLPANYILVLAGRGSNLIRKYDSKIRDRVIDMGMLSQDEADSLKSDADFLICFNNLTYNMVPSKLFECIDSGKPFLNICQLENCPSIPYISDYDNTCIIQYADSIDEKCISSIVSFAEERKDHVMNHDFIIHEFESCTIEYVSNTIAATTSLSNMK